MVCTFGIVSDEYGIHMASQVKPTTLVLGDYLAQCFNLGCFCGVGFSRSLGPNEIELGVPK
jgi:hypothetical protein